MLLLGMVFHYSMVKELMVNVYFRMLEPVRTRLVVSCFSLLLAVSSNPVVFKAFVVLVLLSAEYRVPTFLVIVECIYVRPHWAVF